MTRTHTADAGLVITGGSHSLEVVADVVYGPNRVLQDVPLEDWSFSGDYDAKIKSGGQVTIAYQGDFADSVSPRELTDALAPFGQELHPYAILRAGAFVERIPLGVYRIDEVPSADDTQGFLGDRLITVGSRVELSLLDRFYQLDVPTMSLEKPASLSSAWDEIARMSGLPVTRTVDDVAIPRSIVYSRNRLSAVQQLAAVLGGRAYMRADGTLGVIPDEAGAATVALQIGEEHGTIIDVGNGMTADGVFNAVYGDFEDDDGREIHVEDWVRSGPLAVDGPFGLRPVEYPGDQKEFIRTREAAQTAVTNHLAKVSTLGPQELPVVTTPDPRIEAGDIVTLQRMDRTFTTRIVKWSIGRGQSTSMTARVLSVDTTAGYSPPSVF